MARPDAARLALDRYPVTDTIQTRFQDLDPMGHINNVAMAVLFESGRVRFNRGLGQLRPRGQRFLVARVEINYLAEGSFPEDVIIGHGIGRIGTRSWDVLALAVQDGTPIGTCDATLVMSAAGGADALPDEFRAILEANRYRAD